jgi:hypothetical protein
MGEYKTRSRVTRKAPTFFYAIDNGPKTFWQDMGRNYETTQTTESFRTSKALGEFGGELTEDSSSVKEFLDVTRNGFTERDTQFDTGHPFHTSKLSWRLSHPNWHSYGYDAYGTKFWFQGPLVPVTNTSDTNFLAGKFPAVPRLSTSDASRYGATAVAHTAPASPHANLASFLGELLESVPQLIGVGLLKDRAGTLHSSGGEYLNVEFGWKPFVNDLRKLANSVVNSTRLIRQFKRDSGKLVRRKFAFPPIVSGSDPTVVNRPGQVLWGLPYVGLEYLFQSGSNPFPQVLQSSAKSETIWFSGAFTYHLEASDSLLGKLERYEQLANNLLGTRLTPAVVWELTPWSWLADWVGTIGSFVQSSTLLSADGQVMKYGYLMRTTREFNQYSIPSGLTFSGGLKTGPITSTLFRETKERVKATPYGFGLKDVDFNPTQWAILAALGLTKAPRVLP